MPQDLTDDKSTLGQVMSDKLVLSGNKPLRHYLNITDQHKATMSW